MERPHILFLIDVLYGTHGGAEGVLWKITRRLTTDRYRCSVATFAAEADRVASTRFTCPVYLFPIRRTYDWQALKAALRLARLIRSERVSILHTFFPASDLLGGVVAKLSGCPIVVSSRRDMGFQRSVMHRCAYRLARGLFDQVHAVAEQVRLFHIRQDGLDPARVVTVYNGVDLAEIDHADRMRRSELALEEASHVIVCVANIRPIKALDMFIRTAALVCQEVPGARFLVIGAVQDTGYFSHLSELARRLNVSNKVKFGGRSSEAPSVLKACDLFYLPSRSEGLSNAMLEAMACALPCVATDVGGNGELVDDQRSGYLVPVGHPDVAAERILTLLRDRSLAVEMGRAGRRIVEARFSVETMMSRLTELYEGLLGRLEARRQTESAGKRGTCGEPRAVH